MALVSPRAAFKDRPFVPEDWEPDEREHRRMIALAVNEQGRGKLRNTGRVTLAPNQVDTTVFTPLVEAESCILLSPLTATAASVNWYISAITPQQKFAITHDSSAATDRTFCYVIFS